MVFAYNSFSKCRKNKKRLGRGIGSGTGKTCGRGHKGQKARSGVSLHGFEGGQTPLYCRLPRRGFKNPFKKTWKVLNFKTISRLKALDVDKIDKDLLVSIGYIKCTKCKVKLLASGEISKSISFEVDAASSGAVKAVESCGGSVVIV